MSQTGPFLYIIMLVLTRPMSVSSNGSLKSRRKEFSMEGMSTFFGTQMHYVTDAIKARYVFILVLVVIYGSSFAQSRIVDGTMHYLRNGDTREWDTFPTVVKDRQLSLTFEMFDSRNNMAISVRQFDVKQNWRVSVNDRDIGGLTEDEKDMLVYFDLPSGLIHDGANTLVIKPANDNADDIRVGEITVYDRPKKDVLSAATINIKVVDTASGSTTPCRITITDDDGIFRTVEVPVSKEVAVRPGYIYSSTGIVSISLPSGRYMLYAGRGFEYSVDSVHIELKNNDNLDHTFHIKREVETKGWISSDTHIHTFTHSRHGDATIEERAITIAGEGIELPIMTDHNQNIDITDAAKSTGVLKYFTPVTGNEVTTRVGHFNVFQTNPNEAAIISSGENWNDIASNINNKNNSLAVILNHARDIHNGFRPFDPSHHVSSAGMSTLDWTFPANAMEVMNSGSQQSNVMMLFYDWFGMLNHGYFLTPVGSSDSHDVSRFTVGQGRTYIKSNDDDVSRIDVSDAINNFINGKVMVSLGLLTNITVNKSFGPGDISPRSGVANVSIEVWGPSWADAEKVTLYVNGVKLKEQKIENSRGSGLKWRGDWSIPLPKHDVFLVAIAEGDGRRMPYWPINEPYQPMSIEWTPRLIGSTGAVWIDGDGDGKRSSAYYYAQRVLQRTNNDPKKTLKLLASYHESVSVQAAALLWKNGTDLLGQELQQRLNDSKEPVKRGFARIIEEIREIRK